MSHSFHRNTLKPLCKKIKERLFVGVDVETIGPKKIFFCGSLVWVEGGQEHVLFFECKEDMIRSMLSSRFEGCWFVATNLHFEFTTLFFNTPFWDEFHTIL